RDTRPSAPRGFAPEFGRGEDRPAGPRRRVHFDEDGRAPETFVAKPQGRPGKDQADRGFGGKPADRTEGRKPYGDRPDRSEGARSFGDRPPRRDGDKPAR